ncbi:MAG: hypothetical protein VXW14_06520 [Candidatus Thermoplasmatota archaeon]|nr:hypothetical protein [Candidatus Thermoplasmatota archaeon]
MGTIPRGIHSYQELRKRWMFSVLVLGSVGASTAYLLTASLFITTVCFLFAQVISFADFFRLRKATDLWIEEMLSDLHIDIDDFGLQLTPAFVMQQWELQMKKERSNPLMTRGKDERGFTPGILESDLDANRDITQAEDREEYHGLEDDLTVAQQVKAEADQRYAEHAQQRWEEAERNDPDLIEAGVKRLGDLVATDYFEKNHDPNAVSKLMERQSSSDDN